MLKILDTHELLLASQSPRRSELLINASLPFTQIASDWEEIYDPKMDIYKVPIFLSYNKAKHASLNLKPRLRHS